MHYRLEKETRCLFFCFLLSYFFGSIDRVQCFTFVTQRLLTTNHYKTWEIRIPKNLSQLQFKNINNEHVSNFIQESKNKNTMPLQINRYALVNRVGRVLHRIPIAIATLLLTVVPSTAYATFPGSFSISDKVSYVNWITSVQIILAFVLVPFAIAIYQGASAMLNYRNNYGDAPPPKVPAHGLVIATGGRTNINQIKMGSFIDTSQSRAERQQLAKSQRGDFIRLLVIGDSLAVGIGQSKSCTPVMPEAIAKEISKGSGGTPVYWTCLGESGASTSWIVHMLRNSTEEQTIEEVYKPPDFVNWEGKNRRFHGNYYTNGSDSFTAEGTWTDQTSIEYDNLRHWKKQLSAFRKNFDPAAMSPYDIVVILTGPNDLKSLLLPFMLDEHEKAAQGSDSNKQQGVVQDLLSLMQTINQKVDVRLKKSLEGFNDIVHSLSDSVTQRFDILSETIEYMRNNDTMSEAIEKAILQSINNARSRVDLVYGGIQNETNTLSYILDLMVSNDTLSKKVEKVKIRAEGVKDDLVTAALNTLSLLRSNFEKLQLLFDESVDLQQIVYNDANVTTSTLQENVVNPGVWSSVSNKLSIDELDSLDLVAWPVRPTFVLPAMPASIIPTFRHAPLSWLALPVFDMLKSNKQTLVDSDPDILQVRDPSLEEVIEYEHNIGNVRNHMADETVLLSIKDVRNEDCVRIETSMYNYFNEKSGDNIHRLESGTSIFSVDRIHPNDSGYNFWGRHIGMDIIRQLPKHKLEKKRKDATSPIAIN